MGGAEEGLYLVGVGDVGLDEEAVGLLRRGSAAHRVHVGAHHVRALGGQPSRRREADAAARSGDDGGAADEAAADGSCRVGVAGAGAGVAHWLSSVLMKTFLVSVKAASASGPSSRPSPDCL